MNFTSYSDEAVRLAVDLVNTHNPSKGTDRLTSVGTLLQVLDAHGFSNRGAASAQDLEAVRALRARLRSVFEAATAAEAASTINSMLATSRALPQLTDHDDTAWHVHFSSFETPLVDRMGAETAMGLAVVITDGGFDRMRVCRGTGCSDVFVDMSRNRSRRFCSPEVCGNRSNVAAYRRRRREATN